MKLTHLRDVLAVAERGSLRAAARHLGITQPAITRSIREIEHELGAVLFERSVKGAVVTPMGALFLRRAAAAQNELRQGREEIAQMRGLTTGQVSIALSTGSHIALLPFALQPFKARYPDAFLKISETLFPNIEGALKDGGVDFYIGPLPEFTVGQEFVVETLFSNTRVIFGRKGHRLAGATSLADLTGAKWISTSVTLSSGAELDPLFEAHSLPKPQIEMLAPSALSMILSAANSDLLMMLPEQWVSFPGTRELLEPLTVVEPLPAAPICFVRLARMPLTPAAEFLADMLRRAAEHHIRARGAF